MTLQQLYYDPRNFDDILVDFAGENSNVGFTGVNDMKK